MFIGLWLLASIVIAASGRAHYAHGVSYIVLPNQRAKLGPISAMTQCQDNVPDQTGPFSMRVMKKSIPRMDRMIEDSDALEPTILTDDENLGIRLMKKLGMRVMKKDNIKEPEDESLGIRLMKKQALNKVTKNLGMRLMKKEKEHLGLRILKREDPENLGIRILKKEDPNNLGLRILKRSDDSEDMGIRVMKKSVDHNELESVPAETGAPIYGWIMDAMSLRSDPKSRDEYQPRGMRIMKRSPGQ